MIHFRKEGLGRRAVPLLLLHPGAPRARTLASIGGLLRGLDDADVRYCHWKTNGHLEAALEGLRDLNLLIDRASVRTATRVLGEQGFRRFATPSAAAYVGIEDYLAVDAFTGRLVHLHLYWQLTLGEPFLEGYRLPWEERMLAGRRLDRDGDIYVADPQVELLLLLVRAALELRTRDRLRALSGGLPVNGEFLRELRWLQAHIDPCHLHDVAGDLVGKVAAARVDALAERAPTTADLRALRREVRPPLARCRTLAPGEAARRRWRREGRALLGRVLRRSGRVGPSLAPWRRTVPQGGIIVAVLGAEGSCDSTLARDLGRWLGRKVDVLELRLGDGEGLVAVARRAFRRFLGVGGRRRPAARTRPAMPSGASVVDRELGRGAVVPSLQALWLAARALANARTRTLRLADARRARNLGMIVVCDWRRQSQGSSVNDGRILTPWLSHPSPLLRAAARREATALDALAQCPPDLVIKLEPEVTAVARRPETSCAWLERKARLVHELAFGGETRVVVIDSSRPATEVERDAKLTLWESL